MIFDKLKAAHDARDLDAVLALYHPEYTFVRHKTGTVMSHADWHEQLKAMMASDKFQVESYRCIYENSDIIVTHTVVSFADGTKEAVLASETLKDGLIYRSETGATLLE